MEKLQLAGQKGVVKKKSNVRCIRYGECEKNHAVNNGGFIVDGCKEFIATDENGDSALKCSCCGCHRNFHKIVEEIDQESFGVREQKKRKRRELKSKVWDDFTRFIDEDGNEWAICKHCKEQFDGSSKNGTTHLKNHLASMKCRAKRNERNGNEDISTQIRDLATPTPIVMKEKPSVIDLIKQRFDKDSNLTEDWDPSVLNSRKDEILQVYQEEKEKLGEFLHKFSCRFSLIVHRADDNLILMVQYIDDSWERQTKIISIIPSENYIQETKKACLDLKIDRNICSVRHYHNNDDDDDEIIESWFSQRGSLPFAIAEVRHDSKHASNKKTFDQMQLYFIAKILDPRFKMNTVRRTFEKKSGIDVDHYVKKTLKYFRQVYKEYAKDSGECYEMVGESSTKSELTLYLYHLKVPAVEEFDILAWWRGNAPFYPTLSRMARDYLAIPLINEIDNDSYLTDEIDDIIHCSEIDDGIKSALISLSGLVYHQAKAEKNK